MSSGEYGKIYKRIWGDPDFKALPEREQLLFLKLFSQSDVSLAGVLTLASTRWALQTANLTPTDVDSALMRLQAANFIVCDYETQEVLIRSYISNDGGWKSTKTFKGICNAVRRVLSPTLRGVISAQLLRLDLSAVSDDKGKYEQTPRQYLQAEIDGLVGENTPLDTPSGQVEPTLNLGWDTPSDTPSIPLGIGDTGPFPNTPAPAPAPATANAPATALSAPRSSYSDDFETWWQNYPIKAGKAKAYDAWKKAIRKASLDELHSGLTRYNEHLRRNPDQAMKHAQGWLNDERWNDEYPVLRGSRSTTDERVAGWLALGEQMTAPQGEPDWKELTA